MIKLLSRFVVMVSLVMVLSCTSDTTSDLVINTLPDRDLMLSWNTVTRYVSDECIVGDIQYTLYYGNQSGVHPITLEIPSVSIECSHTTYDTQCGVFKMRCSYILTDVPKNNWYFTLTATDEAGNESAKSNEVNVLLQ